MSLFNGNNRPSEATESILFISLCNYALCVPDNRIQGKKNESIALLQAYALYVR